MQSYQWMLQNMQGGILYVYLLLYDKYTLTQHLTLSHYNHLCSPWFLIQLYTRFSVL